MAAKDKKPAAKKTTSQTKVTRITARDTDSKPKKTSEKPVTKKVPAKAKKAEAAKKAAVKTSPAAEKKQSKNKNVIHRIAAPFISLGGYFKGAWYELQQVTWPNRKATWSLTAALLVYTAFFVVVILLLDALFKYLLELILG
ncbi:MAG TPA: preprotein translocase subunit SecE [Candidatus Saccharimonadales bacterium]|nr:preprotein translocase subunit SecE [Candidatus Saccharimonadales bacterium]